MKRKSRYASRPRDYEYMGWVRQQDCRVAVTLGTYSTCAGPVQAHHAGERAFGRKAEDTTCISLCLRCHQALHDARGFFAELDRAARRAWLDDQIAELRSAYLAHRGRL